MVRVVMLLWLVGCGQVRATLDAGADADTDAEAVDASADASDITEGLIARYQMDEIEGVGTIRDVTGHHDGTCVAPGCPALNPQGRIGGAYEFDGVKSLVLVHVGTTSELNTTSAFTVTAWINRTQTTDAGCFINKAFGNDDANSWQACVNDSGLRFYSGDGTVTHAQFVGQLSLGVWYHVALRWDGSAKEIYVDSDDSHRVVSDSGIAIAFDSNDISIGGDLDMHAATARFAGRIDDVRIYNRALGAEEVAKLAHP